MTVKAIGEFTEKPARINTVLNSNKRGRRLEADKRGGDSEKKHSSGKSKQRALSCAERT